MGTSYSCEPMCTKFILDHAGKPKVYRHTRSMLKIRSTPTDGEQKAQMREWSTETDNAESHIPAIPNGNRDCTIKNSQEHSSPSGLVPPLPSLDLPESDFWKTGRKARLQNHCAQMVLHLEMHLMHHLHQEHASQHMRTLESQPRSKVTNFTCKDTIAPWISGLPVENVEL